MQEGRAKTPAELQGARRRSAFAPATKQRLQARQTRVTQQCQAVAQRLKHHQSRVTPQGMGAAVPELIRIPGSKIRPNIAYAAGHRLEPAHSVKPLTPMFTNGVYVLSTVDTVYTERIHQKKAPRMTDAGTSSAAPQGTHACSEGTPHRL